VAGFFVAWRIHHVAAPSRKTLYAVWEQLVFLLNALSFLYIGLEVPARWTSADSGQGAFVGALWIALVVMLTRFVWMFPAAYLPLWLSPRLRAHEGGYPAVRNVVVASWCGVRGAVSLAAALALPAAFADGRPFPEREQVVFVTLVVVLVTLFVQGSTLGPLVRALRIHAGKETEEELRAAHEVALQAGIARLDEYCSQVSCPLSVHHLRKAMQEELAALQESDEVQREGARKRLQVSREVHAAIHAAQSRALLELRDAEKINDLVLIQVQLELDAALATTAT
jgi:CPA1 family monovalent cation:H+ antiporter